MVFVGQWLSMPSLRFSALSFPSSLFIIKKGNNAMLKIIGLSFLGVLLDLTGIFVLYLYIISLNGSANILFLILSLVLIGGSIFIFIKTGKSDKTVVTKMPPLKPLEESINTADTRLAKNNAMMSDWEKTNKTKDKLRMFEIQSNADSSGK